MPAHTLLRFPRKIVMLTFWCSRRVYTASAAFRVRGHVSGSKPSSTKMSGNAGSEGPFNTTTEAAELDSPDQTGQEQSLVTQHHGGQHQQGSTASDQAPAKKGRSAPVPPAKPTGTLQDMDTNDLVTKRNQILWEQAVRGQQPGLTLMQDKLRDNRQEEWGNEPTIMEPDRQN